VDLDETETLDETTSELSAANWTTAGLADRDLGSPPAMAMLDGHEYYVYTWDEGGSVNPWSDIHELYWKQCSATTCTSAKRIPGQLSMGRVNLAAFNGRIYMVHQGDEDSKAVWFSSLNPATGQWTDNIKLSFETFGGSPALAAFNNRLYMVGSKAQDVPRRGGTVRTYPLWYASMGANETWSATSWIASESASPPSIAVLGSTLYLAHRNGQTADIVIQTMPTGGAWSTPARIPAGPSNSNIQGDDVQLAAVNGYLHLVHHRFNDNYTYWTYNRGCDPWAPEVTVDSFTSSSRTSLATGLNGLVLNRLIDTALWPYTTLNWYKSRYLAPPAPITLPKCGGFF
jgi:hypothetical protein